MKTKSFEIEVNPKVINWLIETSGRSSEELAEGLNWFANSKKPTLRLAKILKDLWLPFFY